MEPQTETLIALAVAYGIHCQPCLQHYTTKAATQNVTPEDLDQAMQIALRVQAGARSKIKQFAAGLQQTEANSPCCAPGSACCP